LPDFIKKSFPFLCSGLWLGRRDTIPDGKYPELQNVRVVTPGQLSLRLPMRQYSNIGQANQIEDPPGTLLEVKNMRQVSDTIANVAILVVIAGRELWTDAAGFPAIFARRNFSAGGPLGLASPGNVLLSGIPGSLVPYRPSNSSQSWMYIADQLGSGGIPRQAKIQPSAAVVYFWGIDPPLSAPTVASAGAGALTGTFTYRARYRSVEGARSNSGIRNPDFTLQGASTPITVTNENITVTLVPPTVDPQVAFIDLFRSSLSQPDFHYVDTITVVPGALTYLDSSPDLLIAAGDLLDDDNDVPWPTVDLNGNFISTKLPYVWGPFYGSLFGCGDPYRPGFLYWTKPDFGDSAPPEANIEVTGPSEQLMNGFIWDGRCWVFSTERLLAIYPNFAAPEVYDVLPTACNRGLVAPWAFCSYPAGGNYAGGIAFVSRDGVYVTDGGAERCISDPDIYPIFAHEGIGGSGITVNGVQAFATDPFRTRLAFVKGSIYFDYVGTDTLGHCLRFDLSTGGWFVEKYAKDIHFRYQKEGEIPITAQGAEEGVLAAGNGVIYQPLTSGSDAMGTLAAGVFAGVPYDVAVETQAYFFDDPRAQKLMRDVLLEYNPGGQSFDVVAQFDDGTVSDTPKTLTGASGDTTDILDIAAGLGVLARNILLRFTASVATYAPNWALQWWHPSAFPKPDESVKAIVEWNPFIQGKDAYVTGLKIWADTEGATKTFQVWFDGADSGITRTFNSNGERDIAFAWPSFKGRLGRLVFTDAFRWRLTRHQWEATEEPTYEPDWDTNWRKAQPSARVGYVTGIKITCDTANAPKVIILQSELEGVITNPVPMEGAGSLTITNNGRLTHTLSFVPFRSEQLRLYTLDQVPGRLYEVDWIVQEEPPRLANFDANWEDDGYLGAKFMQGVVIDADTLGVAKTVEIQYEGGVAATLTVKHTGRRAIAYSFSPLNGIGPFVAHKLRCIPSDPNPSWFYGKRWVRNIHPECACYWKTQPTTHDLTGYQHVRCIYVALESFGDVLMTVTIDGVAQPDYSIPNTGGIYAKRYVPLIANKGLSYEYTFRPDTGGDCEPNTNGCAFRVFQRDCEVRAKAWGSPEAYQIKLPFGDLHRDTGARI